MIIEHIGIVVRTLDEGIFKWKETFGYHQKTEEVINTLQKVKVVFMRKENSLQVKLIEPLNEKSSIYSFAKKGGGLHHLCFKAQNLDETITEFNKKRKK